MKVRGGEKKGKANGGKKSGVLLSKTKVLAKKTYRKSNEEPRP